jgi:hypothetical protein
MKGMSARHWDKVRKLTEEKAVLTGKSLPAKRHTKMGMNLSERRKRSI